MIVKMISFILVVEKAGMKPALTKVYKVFQPTFYISGMTLIFMVM